jgi:hypothetical protein
MPMDGIFAGVAGVATRYAVHRHSETGASQRRGNSSIKRFGKPGRATGQTGAYAWYEYGRSKTSRTWGMNASTGSAS